MASRLGSGIDSPTGQRFEVGQSRAVRSRAATRTPGLPMVTNVGADVESGADGPVVAAIRGGSDYPAMTLTVTLTAAWPATTATAGDQPGYARLRSVRAPFLWG